MTRPLAAGLWLLAAAPAVAQTPADSARARLPRVHPGAVTAAPLAAAPDSSAEASRGLARSTALTVADTLGGSAFQFDTSVPGGPVGVAWLGLAPLHLTLHAGPFALNDAYTGAARFDLLPVAWLADASMDAAAPSGLSTALRDFDAPRPLTEARYQTAQGGLQRIEAVHAQTRQRRLFGTTGRLHVATGYAASAWTSPYANSGVHGHRTLLVRTRFAGPKTTATVSLLHARNRPDASGGIVADSGATIFDPLRSAPRLSAAERGTERTDLAVELLRGGFTVGVHAGTDRLRYTPLAGDTLAFGYRYGQGHAGWAGTVGGFEVAASALGLAEQLPAATRTGGAELASAETALQGQMAASVARGGVSASGSLLRDGGRWYSTAALRLGPLGTRHAHVSAEVGLSSTPAAPLFDRGLGPFVDATTYAGPDGSEPTDLRYARLFATAAAGPFSARAVGFYHAESLTDLVGKTYADTAYAVPVGADRVGAALTLGFRQDASSGFYSTASGLLVHTLLATASVGDFAGTVPTASGQAQLGFRAALFRRDLLADVFVRARGWTPFTGRVLHAPTGLYAVPNTGEPTVPAAGVVDVGVTGRVRVATLWLVYENALADTPLLSGVALVPGHPVQARRLRFGVFWPITD